MLPDQKKKKKKKKIRHKWNKSPHCLSKDCNDSRGTWLLRRRNKWYSFLLHCKLISQTQLFLRLRLKILSNIERPLTACRMSTEKHWSCLLRAHLQAQVFFFFCLVFFETRLFWKHYGFTMSQLWWRKGRDRHELLSIRTKKKKEKIMFI